MIVTGKTGGDGRTPAYVALCPPHISRGPVWDHSRAGVVRVRRFTSVRLARPSKSL
jgi:hypothetical protein